MQFVVAGPLKAVNPAYDWVRGSSFSHQEPRRRWGMPSVPLLPPPASTPSGGGRRETDLSSGGGGKEEEDKLLPYSLLLRNLA